MTATWPNSTRLSMVWTMKKLSVRFSKRKYQNLTPLQFMAWTGRWDKRGLPICLFNMKYLTANLNAYKESYDYLSTLRPTPTGLPSAVTLCSLAVFEGMVRFTLPLCSLVRTRPSPETPVFQATVITHLSAVSLVQIWRIRNWFQSFSKILADAYPETLDRVIVSWSDPVPQNTQIVRI